jgi:hypothetical protein
MKLEQKAHPAGGPLLLKHYIEEASRVDRYAS